MKKNQLNNICSNPLIHDPNYQEPKYKHYCSICGQGIANGEEYIVNDNKEYAHHDCFKGSYDLVYWLGYEFREMDFDD